MPVKSSNIELIRLVAKGLKHLLPEVVFVGGSVTELYAPSDADVQEVRTTDDVDCFIQLVSRQHHASTEEELRRLGFVNDLKVLCRWHYSKIIVDIMPTDPAILGFSNPWYERGLKYTTSYSLDDVNIRLLSLPYFIASKLTALFDRGMNDLRLSKDFEDIVFCLFYCAGITVEIKAIDEPVRSYIAESMTKLLSKSNLDEAIYSVLPGGEQGDENVDSIKEVMEKLV